MRMRNAVFLTTFLLLLGCCLSIGDTNKSLYLHKNPVLDTNFIVFTNDGTLYKLNSLTKEVQWYGSLPFKLLTVDFNPSLQKQNETIPKIILPTIDGDFLYLEKILKDDTNQQIQKHILIQREDVEKLLDVCFDLGDEKQEQYFVYENNQYFVLNIEDGTLESIQQFFKASKMLNKRIHAIIMVNRKLLKQMNLNLQIKWSVISSKVKVMSVMQFAKNGETNFKDKSNTPIQHQKYLFSRLNSKVITIEDQLRNLIFEIQTNSAIISIFGQDPKTQKYRQIKVINSEKQILALEDKTQTQQQKKQKQLDILREATWQKKQIEDFPYSEQFKGNKKQNDNCDPQYTSDIQMCIATQRIMKEISSSKKNDNFYPGFKSKYSSSQLPTIPYSTDKPLQGIIITKQQPYLFYFLLVAMMSLGLIFYRLKVNKLWDQINQMQSNNEQKLKDIKQKMGSFENVGKQLQEIKQMQKMYQINWDKIVYQTRNFILFQGRFLNKSAHIYMIPLNGNDIIGIEQKLNTLFECSHKTIGKLYYYTRNDDSLLIFIENNDKYYRKLRDLKKEDYQIFTKNPQMHRKNIQQIIEAVKTLENLDVDLHAFVEDSVLISKTDCVIKINIIPSIIEKYDQDLSNQLYKFGATRVRVNMVDIIHRLGHQGSIFDIQIFQKQKNTQEEKNFFLKDFYDYILTDKPPSSTRKRSDNKIEKENMVPGAKQQQEQQDKEPLTSTANTPITQASNLLKQSPPPTNTTASMLNHPFLWDSKHRILFFAEFSNYAETYIDQFKIKKMQANCKKMNILKYPWDKQLHYLLVKEINNYRKYDYYSARDLIRLIRNKLNHYHEMPKATKEIIGKNPEQFLEYLLNIFPKLLPFMYAYSNKKRWRLNIPL